MPTRGRLQHGGFSWYSCSLVNCENMKIKYLYTCEGDEVDILKIKITVHSVRSSVRSFALQINGEFGSPDTG